MEIVARTVSWTIQPCLTFDVVLPYLGAMGGLANSTGHVHPGCVSALVGHRLSESMREM